VSDGGKRIGIMSIENEPGDFVGLIRNQRVIQKIPQWEISQGGLGGNPLLSALGCQPCQLIP
jgi:hypothetical protein